jgi:hypothetical protein
MFVEDFVKFVNLNWFQVVVNEVDRNKLLRVVGLVIIPFEDDFFGSSIQGKSVFSRFFRVWHDLLKLFNEVVSQKIQLIEDKIHKILLFNKLDSRAEDFTAFAYFLLLLVVHRRFGVNLC